jgi:hypothetical protein
MEGIGRKYRDPLDHSASLKFLKDRIREDNWVERASECSADLRRFG